MKIITYNEAMKTGSASNRLLINLAAADRAVRDDDEEFKAFVGCNYEWSDYEVDNFLKTFAHEISQRMNRE